MSACGGSVASSRTLQLFVAPDGRDDGDGSAKSPYRTIQEAFDHAGPGYVIRVRAGRYRESPTILAGGRARAPVTLTAAGNGRVVVVGKLRIAAQFVRVTGLTFDGSTLRTGVVVQVMGASQVTLSSNEVRNSPSTGIFVGAGSTRVRLLRNLVHDNGTYGRRDSGIALARGRGAVVASNDVHRNKAIGILIYPAFDDALVNANTVADNSGAGILVGGERLTSDRSTIVNNVVAFNGSQGIRTFWGGPVGTGNRAINNLIFGNREDDVSREGMKREGNFSSEPRFVDRDQNDYRLGVRSAAVGQAREEFPLARDRNGRSRPLGQRPDLGAYER